MYEIVQKMLSSVSGMRAYSLFRMAFSATRNTARAARCAVVSPSEP